MEDSQPSEVQTSASMTAAPQNTLLKDLLIPAAIVIAGLAVGAGMYFGGGSSSSQAVLTAETAPVPAAPVDNTAKVTAVTEDEHIKGSFGAGITIVEYSDFDCVFCSRFHDVMNTIVASDTDVAWVYRHFPLEQLHPQAPAVAVASECVARIGGNDAFWTFTDGYFEARGGGDRATHEVLVTRLVAEAGVSAEAFTSCFENGETLPAVQADIDNAVETGGRGTPWSILIGPTGKTYPINGALPQQSIEQIIEIARQEA